MASAEALVGKTLAARYDVLELLGRGGMGAVYRVLDRELDEVIALKVIRDELASEDHIVERFRNEVKLARRVTHANVARTYELGHADGITFCTMELVEGEPLRAIMARGALSIDEAIGIACALCDGLAAAHAAHVIHRDIKPDNVLVARDGRVVLTDFGIATLGVAAGELSGTPAYMAPEQAVGAAPTTAVDTYAIGVMLYEMLTAQRAFSGTLEEIVAAKQAVPHLIVASPSVPAALDDVIVRATARDPAKRLATATGLRAALAPWLPARSDSPTIELPAEADVPIVCVRPPRGIVDKMAVAEAVQGALLQRLAATPRVRVIARGDEIPNATVVELIAREVLEVAIAPPDRAPIAMTVPLEVAHVDAAAEAIAAAVIATFSPPRISDTAAELVLTARHQARVDISRFGAALELLERAHELEPEDPQIAALLAAALLHRGFFAPTDDRAMLDRATDLVRFALDRGPQHHETHLAAGQLELHVGEPANAAGHFRLAIACARHEPLAHEQLGRMLLEAGYLDQGMARLEEALAIAPGLRAARWQIARAYAMDGRWHEYDAAVAPLGDHDDMMIGRVRVYCYRGDLAKVRAVRGQLAPTRLFVPELVDAMFAVVCDGRWYEIRDGLLETVFARPRPSRRHRAFLAQIVAELAGFAGDHACVEEMTAQATEHGLFDLHWLDRALPLAGIRDRPRFPLLRAQVKQRADAILDALYGDHPVRVPTQTEVSPNTVKW